MQRAERGMSITKSYSEHYAIEIIAAKSVTEEECVISTGMLPAWRYKSQTKFIRTVPFRIEGINDNKEHLHVASTCEDNGQQEVPICCMKT